MVSSPEGTWRKWGETGGFGVGLSYVVFLWDETILKNWPLYFGMFGICRDHEWLKHQGCLSLQCGHCGLRQSGSVASLAADFAADGVPSGAVLGLPTWGKHQQSPKIAVRSRRKGWGWSMSIEHDKRIGIWRYPISGPPPATQLESTNWAVLSFKSACPQSPPGWFASGDSHRRWVISS